MSITTEQAAAWFAERVKSTPMPGAREMFEIAAAALREKAERENPKPLTLEELRKQEGCPVFLVIENIDIQRWAIVDFSGDERTSFQNGVRLSNEVYGITWSAYRHKPKEDE